VSAAESEDVPASYETYAEQVSEPRFTDWLRERTEPTWTEAVKHRFTQELIDGTIDDHVMARYLVQDYAFVNTLVGTFAEAVADAPTMGEKRRLIEFLDAITSDENDYFQRSFDALDVPESERTDPELAPATAAFEDLLVRTGQEGGYAETLAVLVPAEWIYLEWASGVDDPPEQFYLAEWIDLHAITSFRSFVEWLREELDRIGPTLSPRRQARVSDLFDRTVRLEAAFFDVAYEQSPPSLRVADSTEDR